MITRWTGKRVRDKEREREKEKRQLERPTEKREERLQTLGACI
jgi:hypothetical protein